MTTFKLSLVQMRTGLNKDENVSRAVDLITTAATVHGAHLIALPECFNAPFGAENFKEYAEPIPGPTFEKLSTVAKKNKIFLVAGSIPEISDSKTYNTAMVFGPNGELLGTHRKMHLFDIDNPGYMVFKESDTFSPGSSFCTFDTGKCKVGVAICHDLRFPEMGLRYAQFGCDLIIYPGAFEMITGKAHWRLLQQARALDNQMFVAGVASARDEQAAWVTWGHSMIVNPWGTVLVEADETEQIITAEIDLSFAKNVRNQIPLVNQKRADLYSMNFLE